MTKRLLAKLLVIALAITGISLVAPTAALAAPVNTSTALTVDPPSPVEEGSMITLTATITPIDAVGKVIFRLDGFAFDQQDRIVTGGKASTEINHIGGVKTHKISAEFVPADSANFAGSSSGDQNYEVIANPHKTTTALSVSPDSPITEDVNPTLTATITPSNATGTVTFYDGKEEIGSEKLLAKDNGKIGVQTSFDPGTHQLTATFMPDDEGLNESTSSTVTYVVNANSSAAQTSTTLTVSPQSPAPAGVSQQLTATISPTAAAGTVDFFDGSINLGSSEVSKGQAMKLVQLASGNHTLIATFTPDDTAAYTGSTSPQEPYTVSASAKPTSTSLTASPESPQQVGTTVAFNASITPNDAAGSVQLKEGSTDIGEPATVTNGKAQVPVSTLTKGSHQITAVFTSSDPTVYDGSTSTAITYVIAGFPSPPATITATAGNASATVSWTKPTDDGGTPVTGYALQQSDNGGESWTDTAPGGTRTSTATSKVVTGLTNGTEYLFRVAAINKFGNSGYTQTDPESPVTPVAPAATTVTIGGTPTSTTYGTKVTVTGTVTDTETGKPVPGASVRLYQRQVPSKTYGLVATFKANSAGVVSAPRTATASTYYQWLYTGTSTQAAAYSPVRLMSTSYVVSAARTPASVKHGGSAKVYGTVAGGTSGQVVYLQRYLGGKYSTAATTTLTVQTLPNGQRVLGFVYTVQLPSKGYYNYRVYAPTGASLLYAYSTLQSVQAT